MGKIIYNLRENRKGEVVSKENRAYDKFGRLAETAAGFGAKVTYAYDSKGRLARQIVDGSPIEYEYTKYGQLAGKYLGGKLNPDASVTYEYSKSGQIVARTANGVRQTYEYDKKGQLLAVKDADGNAVERYAYDKAGNMLKKQILRAGNSGSSDDGRAHTPGAPQYHTTTFAFDDANQLVSSTTDGVTTRYTYDAAGRLVKEGSKTYRYGYLDKVLYVADGDTTRTFTYHADGQLASATVGSALRADRGATPLSETETFQWDGLALIQRGDEQFINEPHVGGGNPVASSKGTSYFNDALGTTVGSKSNGKYSAAALTAFGESLETLQGEVTSNIKHQTSNSQNFFTGKPFVEGLGYAFLMRNYRAGLAKWQTADPMGYPDGWNQLAYCNNLTIESVDFAGALVTAVYSITRKEFTVTDNQTGRSVTVQNSISGDNVVGHQWVPDVGPIPIGSYTILDHWENLLGWFELWRDDAWFDDFTTGPGGVERGNFRLHPGTFSAGCITLPKDADETRTALSLIGGTATEIICPTSIKFEEKIKFGTLTVIE